ncbi:MAG: hypothetical protein Fur006_51210 [Coleofasciculaceae cyanobacterium]
MNLERKASKETITTELFDGYIGRDRKVREKLQKKISNCVVDKILWDGHLARLNGSKLNVKQLFAG